MSERKTYFVDVILPLSIPNTYTYRLPFELNESIQIGIRVIVPLGKSKLYTGVVVKIHESVPQNYQVKYVESILDDQPIVTANQFKLWKWISNYYLANIGDVMNAALPSNFKLGSETKVSIHPEFDRDYSKLSDQEFLIIEAIELQDELTLKEVSEILQIKSIQPLIKKLIEKKAAIVSEELKTKYRPKYKSFVQIHTDIKTDDELGTVLNDLESSSKNKKQVETLLRVVQLTNWGEGFKYLYLKKN